jgi:hypothetical protein
MSLELTKFSLIGFGKELPEAVSLIRTIIAKCDSLFDGKNDAWEFIGAFSECVPELRRLSEIFAPMFGSPIDGADLDSELLTLMGETHAAPGTVGAAPVFPILLFVVRHWREIAIILKFL